MFESIYITPTSNNSLDIGLLAELLLFYGKVRVVASESMVNDLVRVCPPELIIELIQEEFLHIDYLHNSLGVLFYNNEFPKKYSFTTFSSPEHTLEKISQKIFYSNIGRQGRARRLSQKFNKLVNVETYTDEVYENIPSFLLDRAFIDNSITEIFRKLIPEYLIPINTYFHVFEEDRKIVVETNIDFSSVNNIYSKKYKDKILTVDGILSIIFHIKGFIHFASRFNDEIATDDLNSSIIKGKFELIAKKIIKDYYQIELFQNFIFEKIRDIRGAVNSGTINFTDVIEVVKKSRKFKNWLSELSPESSIIREYYRTVSADTVIDKLPSKTVRWALFSGTGILIDSLSGGSGIGIAGGLGLSAFDSFILDKVVAGWKPNHYINQIENKLSK